MSGPRWMKPSDVVAAAAMLRSQRGADLVSIAACMAGMEPAAALDDFGTVRPELCRLAQVLCEALTQGLPADVADTLRARLLTDTQLQIHRAWLQGVAQRLPLRTMGMDPEQLRAKADALRAALADGKVPAPGEGMPRIDFAPNAAVVPGAFVPGLQVADAAGQPAGRAVPPSAC